MPLIGISRAELISRRYRQAQNWLSKERLSLWQKAPGPNYVDCFLPTVGLDVSHDSMHVILYGELGKVQFRGYLFVREPFRHQPDEFTLSIRQADLEGR